MAVKPAMTVTIWLGFLALAAGQSVIEGQSRAKSIHPTIHRAILRGPAESVLETDSVVLIAEKIVPNEPVSLKRESGLQTSPGDSATSSSLTSHKVSYEYEIEHIKRHVNNFKIPLKDRNQSSCRSQVFRGFDVLRLMKPEPKGIRFVGVGVSDNSFCVFFYNETVEEGWKVGPLDDVDRSSRANPYVNPEGKIGLPLYRVSAVTVRELGNYEYSVQAFDECGTVIIYNFKIREGEVELLPETIGVTTLTSVNLDNRRLSGVASDPEVEAQLKEAKDASESGKDDGKVVMERHFNHAFVEAIAMLEGSLVYSRCFLDTQRVNFINEGDKWPRLLQGTNQGKDDLLSMQAIEAYQHNSIYYYHIFFLAAGKLEAFPDIAYWWCKAKSTQEVNKPNSPACMFTKSFQVGLVPIDVVYRAKCSKVYAFYQHMFQTENADKNLSTNSPFTVVDWMKFPVNAILHHNERLYFFEPANRLRISKPIEDCSFEAMSFETGDFYQSDLLLMFKSHNKLLDYTQTVPIYDGERIYDEKMGWNPPLNHRKQIDKSCKLSPSTSSSSTGALIAIILLLIILFAILGAIIYYFLCTNPSEQAPKRLVAKSSFRQPRESLADQGSVRSALPAGTPSELDQSSIRSRMSKVSAPIKSAKRESIKSKSPGIPPRGSLSKPESGSPAKPSIESPGKPASGSPTKPSLRGSPGKPASGPSAKPSIESPGKPASGLSAKPSIESPGRPAIRSPTKSSPRGSPGKPASGSSVKSTGGLPAKRSSGSSAKHPSGLRQ